MERNQHNFTHHNCVRKHPETNVDTMQMTTSTISTSTLNSPGDSGVILDSESESASEKNDCSEKEMTKSGIASQSGGPDFLSKSVPYYFNKFHLIDGHNKEGKGLVRCSSLKMQKDAQNKMNTLNDEVFEMEHPIMDITESDVMNISLNSYELLDYTTQNNQIMHVSMSEEVNENLKISQQEPIVEEKQVVIEEQIVFRRQRKKKSKDTPKKRVSFHEDILNSTKVDDVHINHGFVTHEFDERGISLAINFFSSSHKKRPEIGRYSWAAENDTHYDMVGERETKSALYMTNRFSSSSSSSSSARNSSSSSSSGSVSSSIEDEDDENVVKEPNLKKQPKSSCLKKSGKIYVDTSIVQEEFCGGKKKKRESALLDGNIFGSLKNILNFSTSVPLAERGVPEGQEDVTVFSSSHESRFGPIQEQTLINPLTDKKNNLKLTRSEGFYPNYPQSSHLPANVIVCDSNVYEHKGISYSYEYDKFQKTFERSHEINKEKKSSTVYQKLLKEFNFFRTGSDKTKQQKDSDPFGQFEIVPSPSNPPQKNDSVEEVTVEGTVESNEDSSIRSLNRPRSDDWSDVTSDMSSASTKHHLNSPKHKVKKNHHYSVGPFFKTPEHKLITIANLNNMRSTNSDLKTSLINRFLRNVTLRKMLDVRTQNKITDSRGRKYVGLYPRGCKFMYKGKDDVDEELDREVVIGLEMKKSVKSKQDGVIDKKAEAHLRRDLFRSTHEDFIEAFPIRSAYATNGRSRPLLLVLTDTTLYIASLKPDINVYCNHFILPYPELNTILIGPGGQTIHFSNYDKDMQCIVTTGCARITVDLVAKLEVAMRRDSANGAQLPAVKQLTMRDMRNLRRAICKQTAVYKDEEYFYYSIVNIQNFNPDVVEVNPLGPNKEGPLMFKTSHLETRWETAYFILKAGVLYMFSSASQRVPIRVLPLINGSCQGARRAVNCPRPHTFELIIEGKILHLAAPDEYVASEWLQLLVHAASGSYNQKEKMLTQSCSLFLTSEHILTVREAFLCTIPSLLTSNEQHQPIKGPQVLSCAGIRDLVTFRLPSAEQSWCVIEFSCREVHECSGDWILYFATNSELENFISTLEILWSYNNENGDSFPLSTIPESDPVSKKCTDVYTSLKTTWPSNSVHLQFV